MVIREIRLFAFAGILRIILPSKAREGFVMAGTNHVLFAGIGAVPPVLPVCREDGEIGVFVCLGVEEGPRKME